MKPASPASKAEITAKNAGGMRYTGKNTGILLLS